MVKNEKRITSKRLDGLTDSGWVELIQLALDYKPVNLGQGFPDFPPPACIRDGLIQAVSGDNASLNQYTRSYGHPRLVVALANLYSKLIGRQIDPWKEVLVTAGAYQALYSVFNALVSDGDEVIIIEPFFNSYEPMVRIAGGQPVFIPLRLKKREANDKPISSRDWILDMAELESKFTEKTKLIVINTPQNPIGKVYSRDELTAIGNLCKKYNVLVLMDEVYEWIIYPGAEHVRMATLPDMWERTITIGSAGKTFSVTGWKTGWIYGPAALMSPIMQLNSYTLYSCNTPIQEALAIGLEAQVPQIGQPDCYWTELVDLLARKRNRIISGLSDVNMTPTTPDGGYFVVADFSKLAAKVDTSAETGSKDYQFVKWMAKNKKLQGMPLSFFYSEANKSLGESLIRFCFIKTDETLEQAEKILIQLKQDFVELKEKI